jgi:hypothetical protein
MTTLKQKNQLKNLTKNSISYIIYQQKILIDAIKNIDKNLLIINEQLLKIQSEIYGRVEIYFGKENVRFIIRQKLSSKINSENEFNQRYYSICDKFILARLNKKPQFQKNKDLLKPLIKKAENLILLRKQILQNNQLKVVNKVNEICNK